MSSVNWKEYLTEMVTTFRKEFRKLDPKNQKLFKERLFFNMPFEPCQIEVLNFGTGKEVILLLIHDPNLPDMTFKIHEQPMDFDIKEFTKKYKIPYVYNCLKDKLTKNEKILGPEYTLSIYSRNQSIVTGGFKNSYDSPQNVGAFYIHLGKENLRNLQIDAIKQSTKRLRKSIPKIPEKPIRDELAATTMKIQTALGKIKRINDEVSKVRQLVGVSQEYQDWKLLVSDVHRLKGELVPKEVFDAKVSELSTRINSLAEIKEAYDKIFGQQNQFMKQQVDVIKQQSSFMNWIKYATILLPIAVVSVPVIEIVSILVRHYLGIL